MALPRCIEVQSFHSGACGWRRGRDERRGSRPGSRGGKSGRYRTVRDRLRSRLKSHPRRVLVVRIRPRTRSQTHIAWDPGALGGRAAPVGQKLDAPLSGRMSPVSSSTAIVRPTPAASSSWRARGGRYRQSRLERRKSAARRLEHHPCALSCRDRRMPQAPHGGASADRGGRDPFLHAGLFRQGRGPGRSASCSVTTAAWPIA